MNCQQVQDLVPLYIGSDLDETRAPLVAAHVQVCETCTRAEHEYRETTQLLQTFVPPAFTEDFYAAMRRSVWQNLEEKPKSSALSRFIADLFHPRLGWALASAVLIAVSAVGIYVISRRGAVQQPFVSTQTPLTAATQDNQPTTSSQNNGSSTRSSALSGSKPPRTNVHPIQVRQNRNTIHDRVNLPTVSAIAAVSPASISAPAAGESRQADSGVSDASHAPLRVEIQTKNPNIRIIWFTPRDPKSSAPNSKGI